MGAQDAHQHLVDLIERKNGEEAEEFWTEHLRAGYLDVGRRANAVKFQCMISPGSAVLTAVGMGSWL